SWAHAGIGAGNLEEGKVGSITALYSRVETRDRWAYAGIGGGRVKGTLGNTTAVNCKVNSGGLGAIGGGYVLTGGKVGNTAAVDCEVKAPSNKADGIGAGTVEGGRIVGDTKALRTLVNGKPKGSVSLSNPPDLCQRADPRVLAPDCTVKREYMEPFSRSLDNDCPVEIPVLFLSVAGGGLVVAGGYIAYHLITGYRQGLRGAQLAMKPLNWCC
ncbi:hypothetical protein J7438_24485, partial [Thalassotalea sp. G20_0]|uniref:hypothetical protein n=1 Tax=Thalassotalea sp. G20_0 TaxID=2821093 RepID=UPI001ADAAA65